MIVLLCLVDLLTATRCPAGWGRLRVNGCPNTSLNGIYSWKSDPNGHVWVMEGDTDACVTGPQVNTARRWTVRRPDHNCRRSAFYSREATNRIYQWMGSPDWSFSHSPRSCRNTCATHVFSTGVPPRGGWWIYGSVPRRPTARTTAHPRPP